MSQVILFDLDGTLTESGEGITKCVQYALGKLGVEEENLDKLRCFVGPPLKEQFMTYSNLTEEQAEQAVAYYRERYTTTGIFENHLYPKIPDLLEILKINDKCLGVASSKPEVFVKQILEAFDIAQYFQVIVGSELDGKRTNKAEVIEEALVRLHMENERDKVLMVGDKEHDVIGARSCGIQCVGVSYGYGTRKELEEAGAVYIADTVEDLGILASPNDEETTEHVESVRKPGRMRKEKRMVQKKKPAGKEAEEDRTQEERPIRPALEVWRSIYPILVHYGIAFLVLLIFTAFFVLKAKGDSQTDSFQVADQVIRSTMLQLIVTSITAGGIGFLLYRNDQRRRKTGFLGKGREFVWSPPIIWISVIVLAIAGGQFLNDLIGVLHLNERFTSYAELTSETMAGQPMWLLFLSVGILAPLTEEIIFRGLVFRRMKDFVSPAAAILVSSLAFGIYHGNIVQFLYASMMGALLAIIYNRTGTLCTSILAHIAANLWSLFGSIWWNHFMSGIPFGTGIGMVIEILICVIPAYWIFANKRK